MKSNRVIVVSVLFILACPPLNRQAAALDRDQDPEQLWNIGWELSQDGLNHRDTLRVKRNRQAPLRDRGSIPIKLQQSALLQELLTPGVIRHESNHMTEEERKLHKNSYKNREQDSGLLEELLVATSMP